MPEINVQDEQGNTHVFPDGSTPEMIAKALGVSPPAPHIPQPVASQEPQLPFLQQLTSNYNPGATQFADKHPIIGPAIRFLDAAGGAAMSIPSSIYHAATDPITDEERQKFGSDQDPNAHWYKPNMSNIGPTGRAIVRTLAEPVEGAAKQYANPQTRPTMAQATSVLPEALGQGTGTVASAGAMSQTLPFLKGLADKIPSKERAGANFQQVMGAAKNVPIDTTAPGNTALQIKQMADAGGSMPKVVRDFIRRATDPSKGPITFEEARQFQQNASRLSVDEYNRLTPSMKRMIGQFSRDLNNANTGAAGQVGKADTFAGAMKEFSQRSKLNDATAKAGNYALQKLPWVAGAVATKKVYDAIK